MSRDRLIVFGATAVLLALLVRPEARARLGPRGSVHGSTPGDRPDVPPERGDPKARRPGPATGGLRAALGRRDATGAGPAAAPPADPDDEKDFALRETRCRRPAPGRRSRRRSLRRRGRRPRTPRPAGRCACCGARPKATSPWPRNLSVTFSQPMVAVTSHDELARRSACPCALTPEPPGPLALGGDEDAPLRARRRASPWPRSTRPRSRRARAPRRAASLARAVRWTFTTPPPTLVEICPLGRARPPRRAAASRPSTSRSTPRPSWPRFAVRAGGAVGARCAWRRRRRSKADDDVRAALAQGRRRAAGWRSAPRRRFRRTPRSR